MANRMGLAPGDACKDVRSRRIIAVIDCILNQNARDFGAATYPAVNKPVLERCLRYDIGILLIPCPEMAFMGIRRSRSQGVSIKQRLDSAEGRACCREISRTLADKIEDYQRNGIHLMAVLGGNHESPGCAVHMRAPESKQGGLSEKSGVLMCLLYEELLARKIDIPFRGMRDCNPDWLAEDLDWLDGLLRK